MLKKKVTHLGSLINANENCSQEIKRRLKLRRAAMEELGKITPTTVHRCKDWAVKKADRKESDSFERWCWRGALWIDTRKGNRWVLEQRKPGASLKAKIDKTEAALLWAQHEKLRFFEKGK